MCVACYVLVSENDWLLFEQLERYLERALHQANEDLLGKPYKVIMMMFQGPFITNQLESDVLGN